MPDPRQNLPADAERDYFAGAPGESRASALLVPLAVAAALLAGWTLWSRGQSAMTRQAAAARTIEARESDAGRHVDHVEMSSDRKIGHDLSRLP